MSITSYDADNLLRAVLSANETFKSVLGPAAKNLIFRYQENNQENNSTADAVENAVNNLEDIYKNKEKFEQAQKKLFEKQLSRRGYDIEKNKIELNSIKELNEVQRNQLEKIDKAIEKEKELTKALIAPGKNLKEVGNSIKSFDGILNKFQDNLQEMTGKSKGAAMALNFVTASLTGLVNSFTVMLDAVYKGERGASVGAKGFKEFADALSSSAIAIGTALLVLPTGKFGIIAKAAGAALAFLGASAKTATKLIEMGAELNDRLYKSYNELSEQGLTTSAGMEGIYESLHKVGMASSDIEKYNKLLAENSRNLAIFGGTAIAGAKKFEDIAQVIAGPTSKINKMFLELGISSDAQREGIISFLTEADRFGFTQFLNDEQQLKLGKKYIENLSMLAKLTGANRKEMEDARSEMMANENFRAALYVAQQDQSEAGQARLKTLKSFGEASVMLRLTGDKIGATGLLEYAAGRGIAGDASATAYLSLRGLIETAERGGSITELAKAAGSDYERQMKMLSITKRFGGDVADMITGGFGQGTDFLSRVTALIDQANLSGKDFTTFAEDELEARKNTTDKKTKQNAVLAQEQLKLAQKLDTVAKTMNGPALAMSNAMKAFNESVKVFKKVVGMKTKVETTTTTGMSVETSKAKQEREQSVKKLNNAVEERKNLEREKGRGAEETKQARIREMQAREDARKKALDEVSMQRQAGKNVTKLPSAVPTPTPATQLEEVGQIVPNKVTSNLIATVKDLEKFHPKAYWDYKQYSIGYGTKASGPNEVITEAEAAARLEQEINKSALFVSNFGNTNKYKWGQNQVDALSSFVYNGGPGFLKQVTAEGKRSNFEILKAIPLYNKAGGKVLPGLEKRRKIEADLFSKDLQAQTGAMFEGPKDGYFVQLHGKEFVGNERHLSAIKNLMNTVIELGAITDTPTEITTYELPEEDTDRILQKFTGIFESKTEELLEKIKFGNIVDADLLTYSQA